MATATYGGLGVALLRELGERGLQTFRAADVREVAPVIGAAPAYLPVLLHRLVRAGLIARVKHGTYTVAGVLPGSTRPHPFAVGQALVEPSAVSGWSALNHHRLTEQIPRAVTLSTPKKVVTPSMRGAKREGAVWTVGDDRFEFVTVVPHHFFGIEEVWLGESRVKIFGRERSLLDCFALPRRFGGLAEGLAILEEHRHELDLGRLVQHALTYGKASVAKRVGWALEHVGAPRRSFDALLKLPIKGSRPLDPTRPTRGPLNTKWSLRENLSAVEPQA